MCKLAYNLKGYYAEVAELVYAHDSKSCLARDEGSTPSFGTPRNKKHP